jgi:hypothetical protein
MSSGLTCCFHNEDYALALEIDIVLAKRIFFASKMRNGALLSSVIRCQTDCLRPVLSHM